MPACRSRLVSGMALQEDCRPLTLVLWVTSQELPTPLLGRRVFGLRIAILLLPIRTPGLLVHFSTSDSPYVIYQAITPTRAPLALPKRAAKPSSRWVEKLDQYGRPSYACRVAPEVSRRCS